MTTLLAIFLGISDLTWTWKLSNDSLLLPTRLVGVAEQLLVRKLESICPRISPLFSILNPAPNLLSLFESPSRMTCNRRLDITVESRKIPKRTHSNLPWINERNQWSVTRHALRSYNINFVKLANHSYSSERMKRLWLNTISEQCKLLATYRAANCNAVANK